MCCRNNPGRIFYGSIVPKPLPQESRRTVILDVIDGPIVRSSTCPGLTRVRITMIYSSDWINPSQARESLNSGSGKGIKVAILDSGIELSHAALRHLRLVDDVAFELSGSVLKASPGWGVDVSGHGTAIAFVLKRAAPDVQLGSFRVLDHNVKSVPYIVEEAAYIAIERGYNVLSCSFGMRAKSENIDRFKPWIDAAYRRGVHVVSGCNNQYFRAPEYPGHFSSVVTVNMARTESDDVFFRWDTQGNHMVEFAARGVALTLPWKDGIWESCTGSSFAAPHVAGLLARLLSCYPRLKPPVAKALLQEIATPWPPTATAPNEGW